MKSEASLHMGKQGDEARKFGLWGWLSDGSLDGGERYCSIVVTGAIRDSRWTTIPMGGVTLY